MPCEGAEALQKEQSTQLIRFYRAESLASLAGIDLGPDEFLDQTLMATQSWKLKMACLMLRVAKDRHSHFSDYRLSHELVRHFTSGRTSQDIFRVGPYSCGVFVTCTSHRQQGHHDIHGECEIAAAELIS